MAKPKKLPAPKRTTKRVDTRPVKLFDPDRKPPKHYGDAADRPTHRLTPLDDIDLSVRTANACQSADIGTLGELSQHTEAWLRKHTYISGKGIKELRDALEDAGLKFRAPPAEPVTEVELRHQRAVLMGTLRRAVEITFTEPGAVRNRLGGYLRGVQEERPVTR
jgi:hypothetical protein